MKKYVLVKLIIASFLIAGCASPGTKYDDRIHIQALNTTTHGEDAYFEKYFTYYINRITGRGYIGTRTAGRISQYTMKISIVDRQEVEGGGRVYKKSGQGSENVRDVTLYGYRIKINLVENETGKLVWSWEPDQWKTYNSAEKAIRWLAKYSARKMHRAGLFGSRFIQ